MKTKNAALLLVAAVLVASQVYAQSSPLQKAQAAFRTAQQAEAALNAKSESERSRAEYLKIISEYQRVYFITPHTSYADDSLIAIARLYEKINDTRGALKALTFLVKEYPESPFVRDAQRSITRLNGAATVAKPPVAPQPAPEPRSAETKIPETKSSEEKIAEQPKTSTPRSGERGSVENITYWEAANSVRVVVYVTGNVKFKQGDAHNPDRVFVDVSPARLNRSMLGKDWPVNSGLLQKVRVGQFDDNTVRVVLDLGAMRKVTSFLLHDPDRLIIDALGDASPPPVAPAPAPVAPSVTPTITRNTPATPEPSSVVAVSASSSAAPVLQPEPKSSKPDIAAPKATAKPDKPDVVVTPARPTNRGAQSLVRSLGLKIGRVVIDAGHGGHDTGSIGPTGFMEKDLVLDVAKRLKTLIETELGAEVVLTRSDDTFIPLETRTAVANQQEADLFISIHANSSRTRTVRGVETFFLGLSTARDALETAARENAASERSIHELQDVVKQIMTQDKVSESRELAEHIQSAMAKEGVGSNRGVKQAHFLVLIGANMPSVLAEINFITNPQEERLLKTAKYRQQIAESLLAGVRSYSNTLSGLKTAKSQGK